MRHKLGIADYKCGKVFSLKTLLSAKEMSTIIGRILLEERKSIAFVHGDTVVVEQHGVWHSLDTGEVTGEKTLASVFQVDDRYVVRFARYDSLIAALEAAGLDQSME